MISDSEVGGLVRQNWPLLAALGVLLGGAAVVYMRGDGEAANASAVASAQERAAITATIVNRPHRKTPQELAVEQIAEHEAKVQADPDDKDAPAYLMAMGNLYRQKLVDYERAAQCYERLLIDHAEWEGVRAVYMQLATCYERLDQTEAAQGVYEKMLDVFPADSKEHEIAYAAVYH